MNTYFMTQRKSMTKEEWDEKGGVKYFTKQWIAMSEEEKQKWRQAPPGHGAKLVLSTKQTQMLFTKATTEETDCSDDDTDDHDNDNDN